MTRVLVVDDERTLRGAVAMMLRGAGYEVDEAADGERAIEQGMQSAYDLVLTDLKMGGVDGLTVVKRIREGQPLTEAIVMTAYGTIESAVEAMRAGAYDYIQKPFTEQELLVKVSKAIEKRQLGAAYALMAQEFRDRYKFDNVIGRSGAIRDVIARIVKISASDATVLITGESGTGKEMVAKAIHANSRRSNRPFVTVNCAAMTETLIESELFGHVKGAFTGATKDRRGLLEEANGATFFFDEVAETTPGFQAKLLRAIQEGEIRRVGESKAIHVDVRIVAATNQDLHRAIAEKRFRQDLYYRLNVVRFVLPPMRDRKEDIHHAGRPLLGQDRQEDRPARAAGRGRARLPVGVRLSGQRARAREHDRAKRGAVGAHRGDSTRGRRSARSGAVAAARPGLGRANAHARRRLGRARRHRSRAARVRRQPRARGGGVGAVDHDAVAQDEAPQHRVADVSAANAARGAL
jgi:two-component system response regulator HydG